MKRPWGPNNYRACSGSSWDGRKGNGMFGQITSTRPRDVKDGLSHTAAFSERIRGDDDNSQIDLDSDLFGLAAPWTEETLRDWCAQLDEVQAAALPIQDSNGGMTWLEGNMDWTRYNHLLPPGSPACKGEITWDGVAMPANSRHRDGVHLLLGDGGVKFVGLSVDADVWRALGTTGGGETVSDTQF
jgi:hypothetical protein